MTDNVLGPSDEDVERLRQAIQRTWEDVDWRSPREAAELAARAALWEWHTASRIENFEGLPDEFRTMLGRNSTFVQRYHFDPIVHALTVLVVQLQTEVERLDPRSTQRRRRDEEIRRLGARLVSPDHDQRLEDHRQRLEQALRAGWAEGARPEEDG